MLYVESGDGPRLLTKEDNTMGISANDSGFASLIRQLEMKLKRQEESVKDTTAQLKKLRELDKK